jgi:hypothetical protein
MNKSKKKENMTVKIKIVTKAFKQKKIYNVSTEIQILCSIISTDCPLLFSRDWRRIICNVFHNVEQQITPEEKKDPLNVKVFLLGYSMTRVATTERK